MEKIKKLTYLQEIDKCYNEAEEVESNIELFTFISWLLVIFGVFIAIIFIFKFFKINGNEDFSTLAETIAGTVGTCWALASVFFVYVAFLGQKKQLIYQKIEIIQNREELKNNTKELKGQRQELKEQNKTITLQRFENSFYNLLVIFNSIIDGLYISKDIKGRAVFETIYDALKAPHTGKNVAIDEMLKTYDMTYRGHRNILSHYFRTLYHLFKLIHEFDFEEKDDKKQYKIKRRYTSIVRAQLSSHEQIVLFYNCLHKNGIERFKPLIETYGLLNNIDFKLLFNPEHKDLYKNEAFE